MAPIEKALALSKSVGICVHQCPVIFEEFEKWYSSMWDLEVDPIKHARKMIAHIDKKRKDLGINRARERIMVDMADRRAMETM